MLPPVASSQSTAGRPEARTESVVDLVAMVLDGRIRIPVLPRCFAWDSQNVLELFDSIHRGFPIGSLLLQQASAEAAEVQVGPIAVMATERREALWVVDGQQRLTSLAAALARPLPAPTTPDDPFVLYFDAATEAFRIPPETGVVESTWVPLPRLLAAAHLREWVLSWPHGEDALLRARILEAGKRLREYQVPLYAIRTTDEALLRTIFTRVNGADKQLRWSELRDALFERKRPAPASPRDLANELARLGMGAPEEDELLPCLVAYQGLDVSRSSQEHLRHDPQLLGRVSAAALPALRRALGFLRAECAIPHLRLLPYPALLAVLTRFFREHDEPNERTQTLLTRWVWRALLALRHDALAFQRSGIAAISSDEEASVQALLRLVPSTQTEVAVPAAFDDGSADSRLALLGMASRRPQELKDRGSAIDVTRLIRERGAQAFRPLFSTGDGPANRLLLPGDGAAAASVRAFIARHGVDDAVLRSHAIDAAVAAAIRDDDTPTALARRAKLLASSIQTLSNRMAEWGRSDRPSLEYLMRLAGS
jgi:hypothetical protein